MSSSHLENRCFFSFQVLTKSHPYPSIFHLDINIKILTLNSLSLLYQTSSSSSGLYPWLSCRLRSSRDLDSIRLLDIMSVLSVVGQLWIKKKIIPLHNETCSALFAVSKLQVVSYRKVKKKINQFYLSIFYAINLNYTVSLGTIIFKLKTT